MKKRRYVRTLADVRWMKAHKKEFDKLIDEFLSDIDTDNPY